jgi:hypothetical protein
MRNSALPARPKVCKGQPDGIEVTFTFTKERNASEVKAYGTEINCLKNKQKGACARCKEMIDDRINQLDDKVKQYEPK